MVRHSDAAATTSAKARREAIPVSSMTFFGPVGQKELDFIDARRWSACPPARLAADLLPGDERERHVCLRARLEPKDVANGSVGYVTAWAQAQLDWND